MKTRVDEKYDETSRVGMSEGGEGLVRDTQMSQCSYLSFSVSWSVFCLMAKEI